MIVKDVIKPEKNTKDDPTTVVVAVVVSLVIVAVIIIAIIIWQKRRLFCSGKFPRRLRSKRENSTQDPEDPEAGDSEVIEQRSQIADAVENGRLREIDKADEGTAPLLATQSHDDVQEETMDERTDQPAESSLAPTPDSDPRRPSDPAVSLLLDFPGCLAYVLRFKTVTSDGKEHVIIDNEHCVLADTEAERQRLDSVVDKFSGTDVHIDHQSKVLTLTDKGAHKESPEDFTKPTMDVLRKETHAVKQKVINTGLGAEELKRQVDIKFASVGVKCQQSRDNQKILLLSSDDRAMPEVEKFVEDRRKTLASTGEFITTSGLRVSVFTTDITKLVVDGIVNAVDGNLSCSGGVSLAIQKAAGKTMVEELRQHKDRDREPAAVTVVVDTTGGNLKCKKVLHAVGPRWGDYKDTGTDLCEEHLTDTIYNCLFRACELGLTTIAIPAVSSGSFGVPPEVATRSYQNAVQRFDQRRKAHSLKHIYFVDTNQAVILAVRENFREVHTQDHQRRNTLRLLLLGQLGVGKSSLGNNLLSKPDTFLSKKSFLAVIEKADLGIATLPEHDIELQVVDTPGLFEPHDLNDQNDIKRIEKEIVKSMSVLFPGPHVVLFVFRADRFGPTEEYIITQVQQLFPDVFEYMIVVFTSVDNDEELKYDLDDVEGKVKELVDACGGRVAGISNVSESPSDLERQVDVLTKKIVDLYKANDQRYYSSDVILRCLQLMVSSEYSDKSVEEMKREILAGTERGNRPNVAAGSDSCTVM